jgi:hypothetical protein
MYVKRYDSVTEDASAIPGNPGGATRPGERSSQATEQGFLALSSSLGVFASWREVPRRVLQMGAIDPGGAEREAVQKDHRLGAAVVAEKRLFRRIDLDVIAVLTLAVGVDLKAG